MYAFARSHFSSKIYKWILWNQELYFFIACFCLLHQVSGLFQPPIKCLLKNNGRSITFTLNGDEFIWWAKSVDNFTLIWNNEGELVYAIKDEKGDLIPSSVLASNPEQRTIEEKLFLNQLEKNLFYSDNQLENVRKKKMIDIKIIVKTLFKEYLQ